MQSLVMYGNEYDGQISNSLMPAAYKYRFLVEGDSWMDRSSMYHTSLLQQLAREFDANDEGVLIINLSMFGDTMRRIGDCVNGEMRLWLRTQFNWEFDAILLSAGGNDYIDAARDPAPGAGILNSFIGKPPPASADDCVNKEALAKLVDQYIDPNFTALYGEVESSRHNKTPVFLNYYHTPVARNAPAIRNGKSWLYAAYTKNGIPPNLWPELTDYIFSDLQMTIAGWTQGRPNVYVVPTDTNGMLTPADSNASGSSGDWLNEIHPNESGWEKLATVWRKSIAAVL